MTTAPYGVSPIGAGTNGTKPHAGPVSIRDATTEDGRACADIYAPYVRDTAISFEQNAPTQDEMARRISAAQQRYAWLVLEIDAAVVGYAYGSSFRARAAYRWTCEVSVYLAQGRRRTGGGRQLYEALFERLCARGYRTAVAGMTLPNDASVGLHRAMGFESVGVHRGVGRKFGQWHDVAFMQRPLLVAPDPPAEPN